MPKPDPFYPPRRSALLVGFIQAIGPLILKKVWEIEEVAIPEDDLRRLRSLRNLPGIILSNHPSLAEPAVLFYTLGLAGVSFYSLVAWDTIALHGWLFRSLLQRVGGYSILRGRRDRASMKMTQHLMANRERIVIFPEGQTYGLNDTLIPFQQGVAQMGFWALEDLRKRGLDFPILLVPIAIKYRYTRPMDRQILASLERLEDGLDLRETSGSRYDRLSRIAEAVVARVERDYELPAAGQASLNERILRVRESLVAKLAAGLNVELPREAPFPLAVQLLANALDDLTLEAAGAATRSERKCLESRYRPYLALWLRLKNFLAIQDGYVRELPSAERYADVLARLEVDVLGRSRIHGLRRAEVRLGRPIELRDHLPAYRERKRETVGLVTAALQERVWEKLRSLFADSWPGGRPDAQEPGS